MPSLRYLSLCSGIEATSVAWEPLGWEPIGFCEIEEFPSAVLAHRFPSVPKLKKLGKKLGKKLEQLLQKDDKKMPGIEKIPGMKS